MTGTLTGADQGQYALAVNGSNPLLDVQDNIFLNTQATGAANNSYAIGLGYALSENMQLEKGMLKNPCFRDYKLITAPEMPPPLPL